MPGLFFWVLISRARTFDPPVAPDAHVWRQTPTCDTEQAGVAPNRRSWAEIRFAGSVGPRRRGRWPAACNSAPRFQHLRKGQLPIAGVGWGGLPHRWEPASSSMSGALPQPHVAGAAVADHPGRLWQSSGSWWLSCVGAASVRSLPVGPDWDRRRSTQRLPSRTIKSIARSTQRANQSLQLTGRPPGGRPRQPARTMPVSSGRRGRPAAELNPLATHGRIS